MSAKPDSANGRKNGLSRATIIAAAIDILDAGGQSALTFRALASRLSTGSGAIYWHVADKDALLSAAADRVLSEALAKVARDLDPVEGLRQIALSVFDVIEARPWVGSEIAREPWQPAMAELFEHCSARFADLGVPQAALFPCVSALTQYILGAAAQTAAAAQHGFATSDQSTVLDAIVDRWMDRNPVDYPYVHLLADQMRQHDDRAVFLVGLELIVAGAKAMSQRQDVRP